MRTVIRRKLRARGFTLIELMVTIALLSILAALAMPSFSTWVQNSRVRAVSDSLQNGLRLAQAEALRRSRQTVFSLTNNASQPVTAVNNGKYWSINSVALVQPSTGPAINDNAAFVESGVLGSEGSGVNIVGPASICFNSLGRLTTNASPGVTGAACTMNDRIYNISSTGSDRSLNVTVSVGGQVRMCDPAKTLTATTPDGCPPTP